MLMWVLLFCAKIVYAQEVMHLVVLEFSTVGEFDQTLLLQLSDQTRGSALEVFPKRTSKVQVLTRESLMDFVQQQGKDASCLEGECAVEIARNIDARFAIVGNAYSQNGTYRVTLKAFDSASNQLLGQENVTSKNANDLLNQVEDVSFKLIEKTIGPFDPTRKGIQNFSPDSYTIDPTPFRIVRLEDDLLQGAKVEIAGQQNQCDVSDRKNCAVLVDSSKSRGVVELKVSKPGYVPIEQSINVDSPKDGINVPVSLRFIPVYGVLKVTALDPKGQQCKGTIEIDGEPVGDTPWSGKVLAKPSIVKVDCRGMAGKQTVEVLEKQTESLKIMVQSYSLEDYRQAQQKLFLHRVIDWSLIATSGTTGALASSNFSQGQQAFLDASSIQSANDSLEYQELLASGSNFIQKANVNIAVCGASAGVGFLHHVLMTRSKRRHVDEIKDIRDYSGIN